VHEEERAVAQAETERTDVAVRLAVASKDREELRRQYDKYMSERQQKLNRDLLEASTEIEKVRAQIDFTGQKLVYVADTNGQLQKRANGVELTIFRKTGSNQTQIAATENTELLPGDFLEVFIRAGQAGVDNKSLATASTQTAPIKAP
jgi:hypothetical protein